MSISTSQLAQRWRYGLAVVPMSFVIAGIVLGQVGIEFDRSIGDGCGDEEPHDLGRVQRVYGHHFR